MNIHGCFQYIVDLRREKIIPSNQVPSESTLGKNPYFELVRVREPCLYRKIVTLEKECKGLILQFWAHMDNKIMAVQSGNVVSLKNRNLTRKHLGIYPI